MYKYLAVFVAWCAVSYARPHWQMLPSVPGYIPVYIQHGDTPLEEINLELAEAFHAIPSGRSAASNTLAAADDKEENIVAEMSLVDAPNPPELEETSSERKKDHKQKDSIKVEAEATSLSSSDLPEDVAGDKRAHEKKTKKAGFNNIQKIPANSEAN